MQTFKLSFTIFFLIVALTGCEKNPIVLTDTMPNGGGELRVGAVACSDFNYADTIFYLREQQENYIVSPVKVIPGIYGASPMGLQIDAFTGAINVSKSETGLRYKVFYVRLGTTDTCSRYVTISGVDYPSSFYVLSRNDTLLKPLYNGRSGLRLPCTDSNNAADNCEFDGGDPTTGQQLTSQGVAINRLNGAINLKRTVKNGIFGINPVNSTARIFRLYYKINDASKKAPNHIDIKLIYFDRLINVPNTLITKIKTQNARLAAPSATGKRTGLPVGYATADDSGGRPPDIVVTGIE